MNTEFLEALDMVEKDKGISKDILIEAIESALLSAFKKEYSTNVECEAVVNRSTGEMGIYAKKTVVEEVEDPFSEISLEDAKKINAKLSLGDTCEVNMMPKTFGRIAAQTAKQVVVQRIREAERNIIFNEYSEKKGDLISGLVQRVERSGVSNVMVEIGRLETILLPSEQIPGEVYRPNSTMKFYIVDVKDDGKGPQLVISRTHPGLVKRLFEAEVPEIANGVVEIKGISREAGSRSKIAVYSNDSNVDPIGACIGPKGMRVSAILDELNNEKIDIVNYSEVPEEYITAALAPAKVLSVECVADKSYSVTVPDSQLSLAIGKEGQNARLAARLTGYKIDIKSVKDSDLGE